MNKKSLPLAHKKIEFENIFLKLNFDFGIIEILPKVEDDNWLDYCFKEKDCNFSKIDFYARI